MSRFLKWAYSVGFFLAMCGLVAAGSYQYLDHLNIPYNINLFNCVSTPLSQAVSCTSMTLQNSGGVEIFTASNPGSVTLTNSNVTLSGSPVSVGVGDGSDSTQGARADTPLTSPFNAGSVVSVLKGIMANVLTPISVTGTVNTTPAGSPQNVTVSNQATVNAIIASSPVNVTVANTVSPAGVAVVNNVAVTTPTPLNVTVGNTINATTTPATSPGNVTVNNSPLAVTIASSPVNVTGSFSTTVNSPLGVTPFNGASPQNVTLSASPVSVAISTVSSPVNVTGNFSTTVNSPLGVTPFNGASPQNVTLSASPVGVAIAGPTPLNVTVGNNVAVTTPTPLNVTIATGTNITQIAGNNIASPTGYGTAPVGSVQGVNAFVTNTVNATTTPAVSPQNVTIASTPLNITVGSSPVAVTIASSPVNITGSITANSASPTNVNLDQINGQLIASPQSYGTAPNGSVMGVNAFVTNNVNVTTPTPLQVTLPGTPLNVTIAGPTPLAVTLPSTPVLVAISTVSSPVNVTGSFTANSSSPTTVNIEQIQNVNVASPSTYGVAPVGSVGAVNAFVTNNVNVTPPTPLGITLPASPISVAIGGPTPLNVTLGTPLNVTVGGIVSPQNVTLATGVNITQIAGNNIASPTGYGTAPVGSVQGVNAFVTNNVNVTTPTPLGVTLPGTPLNVTLAGPTPLNVTIGGTPLNVTVGGIVSPQNITISGSPENISLALPLPDACSYQAKTSTPFAVQASNAGFTPTQIVTGSVGQQVIICSLVVMAQTAAKVTIFEGVGQNCQGAPIGNAKPIWGASPVASGLSLQVSGGWVQGNGVGTVGQTTNASNSVCLLTSQVSTSLYVSGNISYVYK